MEEQKVICPVCGGKVREDYMYDYFPDINENFEYWNGSCEKCGEIIKYAYVYPRKDYKIEIVDHYKD